MLVTYRELLSHVRLGRWALPTCNAFNLESAQAILAAAEELRSPVVIEISARGMEHGGGGTFVHVAAVLADHASVPVALHYDHATSVTEATAALSLPFSSVMLGYDTARSLQENMAIAKRFTKRAHDHGVAVQGEVGHVTGPKDHWRLPTKWLTRPRDAALYARTTAADTISVSVGNRHGIAAGSVTLDWERLAAIKAATDTPLVLHGGSGLSRPNYAKVVSAGVVAINFDTDLRYAFGTELRRHLHTQVELIDPRRALARARTKVTTIVREKIRACGAAKKAW